MFVINKDNYLLYPSVKGWMVPAVLQYGMPQELYICGGGCKSSFSRSDLMCCRFKSCRL